MSKFKSIDKSIYLLISANILLVFLALISMNFPKIPIEIILLFLFLLNVFLIILYLSKIKLVVFTALILVGLFYLLLGVSFRHIRSLFPVTGNNESFYSSSFVKYYSYPAFFDIFLFLIIIFMPIVIYFTLDYVFSTKKIK